MKDEMVLRNSIFIAPQPAALQVQCTVTVCTAGNQTTASAVCVVSWLSAIAWDFVYCTYTRVSIEPNMHVLYVWAAICTVHVVFTRWPAM